MYCVEPAPPTPPVGAKTLLADVHYKDEGVARKLTEVLLEQVRNDCQGRRLMPVFMMVGANSSTGDSLGPFVGWFLKRMGFAGVVIGDLAVPVHATNLKEKIREAWLSATHHGSRPYIIAVDAAVGRPGRITINRGPLRPGAGMGKNLPPVGEVHIMGGTAAIPSLLWFASLDQTVGMAEIIAGSLADLYNGLAPEVAPAI